MNENKPKTFWLGNAVLTVAFIVLLGIGKLWEAFGFWAMLLWIALVGLGVYLLLSDKSEPPSLSD